MSTTPIADSLANDLFPGLGQDDDWEDEGPVDYGNEVTEVSDEIENTAIESDEADIEADIEEAEVDEEPEVEAEPEVEEAVEEADDADREVEEAPQQKQKIMIPKSRLDDEVAKRRKLEAEIKEIKAAREKQETDTKADEAFNAVVAEANKLLRQANEKVLDGDLDAAAELQQQALVKMATAKAAPKDSTNADPEVLTEQIEQRIELKATLKDIYRRYPMMDNNSENADSALIERAVAYEKLYADMGHSPAQAVERAVEDAVRLLRPDLIEEAAPVAKAPKVDPEKKRAQEKRSDVSKKVEMAKKQPPKAPTSSSSEPALDLQSLSEDEFDALPASTRAKLRGDFV